MSRDVGVSVRVCDHSVAHIVFEKDRKKPPRVIELCLGAFAKGGLFDAQVVPVGVLVLAQPGTAAWRRRVSVVHLAGRKTAYRDLLVGVSGRATPEKTLVAYAIPGGEISDALRSAGWGFVDLRGGGHVGFDVMDPGGGSRAFVSARTCVSQLGTRSVAAVANLRPHWRPRFKGKEECWCWPPGVEEELRR